MTNGDWMKDFKDKMDKEKSEITDITEKVLELLKGKDRVTVMPTVLANIFESLEHIEEAQADKLNFENQIMYWGVEHYISRKVKNLSSHILALYNYCVDKEFTEDNRWEYGGGDRVVCYIPNDKKKVLLFENQNVKFVVVLDIFELHVREVYESLFDEANSDYGFYDGGSFSTVADLREGLKGEKGLEIALMNLTSPYRQWADSIDGHKYPSRIDLNTMKNADFGKDCPAFKFGDCRDAGYIISNGFGRSDVSDYNRAKYIFFDITNAVTQIPKSYLKQIKRNEILDNLL